MGHVAAPTIVGCVVAAALGVQPRSTAKKDCFTEVELSPVWPVSRKRLSQRLSEARAAAGETLGGSGESAHLLGRTKSDQKLVQDWLGYFAALEGTLERLTSPNRGLFDVLSPKVRAAALHAHCRAVPRGCVGRSAAELRLALEAFEAHLARCGGPFLLGEAFTLADICGACALRDALQLLPPAVLGTSLEVRRWFDRCLSTEALSALVGAAAQPADLNSDDAQRFQAAVQAASVGLRATPCPGDGGAELSTTVATWMAARSLQSASCRPPPPSRPPPAGRPPTSRPPVPRLPQPSLRPAAVQGARGTGRLSPSSSGPGSLTASWGESVSAARLFFYTALQDYALSEFGISAGVSLKEHQSEQDDKVRSPDRSSDAWSNFRGVGATAQAQAANPIDEEEPWLQGVDPEALCFGTAMTPESELTKGAASTSQWWDVEVLKVTQDYAAVFKPAGLGTGARERSSTSFAHVVQRRLATPMQPELCNRLGLHASGLQMVAKSSEALEHFLSQRMAGKVCSEHLALVEGFVGLDGEPAEGVIDVPINVFQDSMGREVGGIVCSKDGQRAVTKYKVLRRWRVPATTDDTRFWGKSRWFSLVQIQTLTDRLNQIQAHLAFIGHPLVCDCRYGAANFELDSAVAPRLFLHHARIEFEDMHGQNFAAASELAPDLQAALLRIVELAGELE
ncbi:unnamed protein product, partial [Polarella glacialis]